MKKMSCTLLLLILLLGACSRYNIATESAATQKPEPTNAVVAASVTKTPEPTETAVPAREAMVSEIENDVFARTSSIEEFIPASVGMGIFPSGGVETGIDGRARLNLLPEETIVRVGPNSSFTIPDIAEENGEPKTTIELFFGKIYILLNGGSLDVNTPTGTASVRGSLLSVEYDPEKNIIEASCLEGHCALENEAGEVVELITGESSYIQDSLSPIPPERIDREEIQEWLDGIPELKDFLEELPNPEDFPEPRPLEDIFQQPGSGIRPPGGGLPGDGLPGDGIRRR